MALSSTNPLQSLSRWSQLSVAPGYASACESSQSREAGKPSPSASGSNGVLSAVVPGQAVSGSALPGQAARPVTSKMQNGRVETMRSGYPKEKAAGGVSGSRS